MLSIKLLIIALKSFELFSKQYVISVPFKRFSVLKEFSILLTAALRIFGGMASATSMFLEILSSM